LIRFCHKILSDNKNSTGKVNHLVRCPVFDKTDHQLTNKVRGQKIVRPLFEVEMSSGISNELAAPFTPVKSTVGSKSDTPLKALLLSNTPYHNNSVEKNKLINSLLVCDGWTSVGHSSYLG